MEGKYYCPGCGLRFDTTGVCRGKDEAGHEPINVAPVSKQDVDPVEARADVNEQGEVIEQPKKKSAPKKKAAPKRKPAAKKKTTARRR